jgi:hypothetical protein
MAKFYFKNLCYIIFLDKQLTGWRNKMEFKVRVTNIGGVADAHQIRLIDAAEMYQGLDRSISYILNSYEEGRVVQKIQYQKGVEIFQRRTSDNCLTHELFVLGTSQFWIGALAGGVAGNLATDLVKSVWKAAIGRLSDGEEGDFLRRHSRMEPFFDALVSKVEPYVAKGHSTVQSTETTSIEFGAEDPMILDIESKDYVSSANRDRNSHDVVGHVTRLNLVTGNGRFYSESDQKIVPFSQSPNFKKSARSKNLSWSLRREDREQDADLELSVRGVRTANGRLKRYIVYGAKRVRV